MLKVLTFLICYNIIKFDVCLPTNSYTADFSKVKLIGSFNNWSRKNAIQFIKDKDESFYADIESVSDTIEYQLIGLSKGNEMHSWNGTMSDNYKYGNGGDFKSVIYKNEKAFHIVFDPNKLIPENPEIKIISGTSNLAEIRMIKEELENRKFMDSLYLLSSKDSTFSPDFNSSVEPIIKKLDNENDPVMKSYYYFRYLYRARDIFMLSKVDTVIAKEALKEIDPASSLWSINPNFIFSLSSSYFNRGQMPIFREYNDKVISMNKDPEVLAEALWSKCSDIRSEVKIKRRNLENPKLNKKEDTELFTKIVEEYKKKNNLTDAELKSHSEELSKLMGAEYQKAVEAKKKQVGIGSPEIKTLNEDLSKQEEIAKQYFDRIINEFPETRRGKIIKNEFFTLKKDDPVPEFEVTSLEDKKIKLSSITMKGKCYLIDFWATWCGPCIGTMPELHEAYKKLKDKNLEILSISLDTNDEVIAKFRKERYPMPWLHARLEKGFEDEMTKKFGVDGIPKVFLVSKDGRVLATDWDLKGQYFIEKIEKLIQQ